MFLHVCREGNVNIKVCHIKLITGLNMPLDTKVTVLAGKYIGLSVFSTITLLYVVGYSYDLIIMLALYTLLA